jgi:hypothetical protein
MPIVRCPDCGTPGELPRATRSGDVLECPHCAGLLLRVREDNGQWSTTLAYRVSCPECDEVVTLPEDVKPGDTIECCGRTYRLTFQYGAFAAESDEPSTDPMPPISHGQRSRRRQAPRRRAI